MVNYELRIMSALSALSVLSIPSALIIPIIQNLPMGEQGQFTNLQIYKFTNYLTLLRNSASVMAVAIATFRLSEVSAPAG